MELVEGWHNGKLFMFRQAQHDTFNSRMTFWTATLKMI